MTTSKNAGLENPKSSLQLPAVKPSFLGNCMSSKHMEWQLRGSFFLVCWPKSGLGFLSTSLCDFKDYGIQANCLFPDLSLADSAYLHPERM